MDGSYIVEGEYLVTVERLKAEDPRRVHCGCVEKIRKDKKGKIGSQSTSSGSSSEEGKKKRRKKRKDRKRAHSTSSLSTFNDEGIGLKGSISVPSLDSIGLSGDEEKKRKTLKKGAKLEKPDKEKIKRSDSFLGRLRNSFKSKDKPKIKYDDIPIEEGVNFKYKYGGSGSGDALNDLEGEIKADKLDSSDAQLILRTLSRSPRNDGANDTGDEAKDIELDVPAARPPSPTLSECGAQLDEIINSIASGEFLTGSKTKLDVMSPKIGIRMDGDVDLDLKGPGSSSSSSSSSSKGSKKESNTDNNAGNNEISENSKPQINIDIIMLPKASELESDEASDDVDHEKAIVYNVQTEDSNSPEGKISINGSLNGLNLDENKNDPSVDDKYKAAKPKLSLLNKIKRSFKPCSGDKGGQKEMNVRQLDRPPSVYVPPLSPELDRSSINGPSGLEGGLSASIHSITASIKGSRAGTPVLEILAKNPEMTSDNISITDGVKAPTDGGSIKEVNAEFTKSGIPGESRSLGSGQSRSLHLSSPDSLTHPLTLTQVTPIPGDASYANDGDIAKPKLDLDAEIEGEIKPRKRKSSFVDKLKRTFSFGKNDKKKDISLLSKSVPVLNIGDAPTSTSISLPHIHRSASMDDIASIVSSQTDAAELRYQIVLKSPKINKSCKCHVCRLVRRNVRQYCSSNDVTSKRYEVVLKMNMLGADFLNSECGSIRSNNLGYMIPDIPGIAAEVRSQHSSHSSKQELNGTKSEIEDIVRDFKAETSSISSKSSSSSSQSKSGSLGSLGVATGDEISQGMLGSPSPQPPSEPLSNSRQSAV